MLNLCGKEKLIRPAGLGPAAAGMLIAFSASPALATFHLMQIEQVIGGVNGDVTAQAIQLRMRTGFQNFVSAARLRAWDAAGENPVVIIDFPSNVTNQGAGVRVLAATAGLMTLTDPPLGPDFMLTNAIPASYLAAGSLTFEDQFGTVYWRLSWGGSAYTGSTLGSFTNDGDGDFGPPFADELPSNGVEALLFEGSAVAGSTTNATDYALTGSAAVFTNNAGASFVVQSGIGIDLSCLNDFVGCMTGPIEPVSLPCSNNDLDIDGHADLFDVAILQVSPGCP